MRLISIVLLATTTVFLAACEPPAQPQARVMTVAAGPARAAPPTAATAPATRSVAVSAPESRESGAETAVGFASAADHMDAPADLGGMSNGVASPAPTPGW